ncbi:MAG: hypothetical protein ACOH2R_13770, partial [Pseudomonas sp.]
DQPTYRYTQFVEHYRSYASTFKRSMRQQHRAGEKLFTLRRFFWSSSTQGAIKQEVILFRNAAFCTATPPTFSPFYW